MTADGTYLPEGGMGLGEIGAEATTMVGSLTAKDGPL